MGKIGTQRPRIKFCGMTRKEDVHAAVALGVDAIGIIFYPQSPRAVTLEQARILTANLPPFIAVVAVLVNPDSDQVKELLQQLPIDLLQFHGQESPDFCRQFHHPYVKAIAATSTEAIQSNCLEYGDAKALLLDTPSTQYGGTGTVFDWDIIPEQAHLPLILAGGLNENNVASALRKNIYAFDLCSGLESAPGIKDYQKMYRLMQSINTNAQVNQRFDKRGGYE